MTATSSSSAIASVEQVDKQESRAWRTFRRNRLAVISAAVLLAFVFIAVFGDFLMPYDPNAIDAALAGGKPQPPSAEHWLGTDAYGRDYLSRTIASIRVSLLVGVTAVFFQLGIGVTFGLLSGYYRGRMDNALMRTTDAFLAMPAFLLLLMVMGILGGSLPSLIFAIGALNWMTAARLVRAEVLSLMHQEFVTAGQCLGASQWRIMRAYLLPNLLSTIIVAATLFVPVAILTESALSFLGMGVPPPNASLGNMLSDAQQWMRSAWWIWVVPGLTISLIVLAFNFVGDGLRDALDPRLRS
ncbi:MAG: ABC transporter permease [Anaerolineae bacterium]